ncbi:hypothetical protein FACS1894110_24460 [Spirochaetia bacterium]|nr:hypothetical protein FACS1894110_24460 [Spirochaetia bacterium]
MNPHIQTLIKVERAPDGSAKPMNLLSDPKGGAGMTAKGAIKKRCNDCAGIKCTDEKCALYGLMKSKSGAKRGAAIRVYCRWCMNRSPVNQCAYTDCGIYQYRACVNSNLRVAFIPKIPPKIPPLSTTGKVPGRVG